MEERHYELDESERSKLLEKISDFLMGRDEIRFAYAYGSFIESLPFHDIDIGTYLEEDYFSKTDTLEYILDISEQLRRLVRFPVDVQVINRASLGFQFNVTRGRLLSCRDEEFRLKFVERVRRDYYDFEPMARQILREVLR